MSKTQERRPAERQRARKKKLETELASPGLYCPTRCWFDAFLHWISAAEEGTWMGLKPDLQGGTGFSGN